ncbi:uncharacterized protein LOC127844339 [Dreissena polymorpha]|uniref:Uncharacterized protein n=1 Tax=Dreissena polymorpha TaxID=45954 RepID=A0A9D4II63_DREPO|nr:uncharacterized protein LOC127844339 [Dreissena polymorpha]KAH3775145.1 hypothetical protein DPMN_176542 [Dreissena polymorpha]
MASNSASVLQSDILHSISRIQQARTNASASQHVGVQQNQWQRPITEFGDCPDWSIWITKSAYVGNIDFDRAEWAESRQAVDEVMKWILEDIRLQAKNYKGLRIDSYVRQGSSREGLKVYKADEFDSMLEFHIEGLENRIKQTPIYKNGKIIPAFCYITISDLSIDRLQRLCPELSYAGLFEYRDGHIFLSSKVIHEKVFESMVDKAINTLSNTIREAKPWRHMAESFTLTRKMNPPAINVTIEMKFHGRPSKVIDLDLVPAYLFDYDRTTTYEGVLLNCPIHAICKWVDGEDLNQNLIWSSKSTGYEMHIFDVARNDPRKRKLFILTAVRIIKTYFVKTKEIAKAAGHPPPQITTVLKSYHLRQIAFYAMYYLCHRHPTLRLDCASAALSYVIGFLEKALKAKRLPHFFYSSRLAQDMLPGYPEHYDRHLRFNLFRKISIEALERALQSLGENLIPNLGFSFGEIDDERKMVFSEFEGSLSTGDYF